MNKNNFMKAMSMIDDDIIQEADSTDTVADTSEYETSVSGVERYNRPVFYKVAAFAASLVLVAGVGAVGTYYLSHRGSPAPDDERIIAASTAESSTSEEGTEVTTMHIRKKDKLAKTTTKSIETKESSNTEAVTDTAKTEENTYPVSVEDGEQVTETDSITTSAPEIQTTFVVSDPKAPENFTKPISAADEFENFDIFQSLTELSYVPYTCDGIPEYVLYAPDGTRYHINFTEGWVWRKTPDMSSEQEPEEGYLTKTQWAYLHKYGAEIGMFTEVYG